MLRDINLSLVVNLVAFAAAVSVGAALIVRLPGWVAAVAVSGCMIINGLIAEYEEKNSVSKN
jgi:hypothetical protein